MSEVGVQVAEERGPGELVHSRDPKRIAGMFNRIAPTYDLMNRVMTFGQDTRWRRLAAAEAMLIRGESALDIATGTGDLARELATRVQPTGSVVGLDVAEEMLVRARLKTAGLPVSYESGDVADMTFDAQFDAVSVGFGFRNFADREAGMMDMARALKPRGRLVILELVPTRGRIRPLVDLYEQHLIPLVGRLVSRDADAYRYLPMSVAASVTAKEIAMLMQRAGIVGIRTRSCGFGNVVIVRGIKPA